MSTPIGPHFSRRTSWEQAPNALAEAWRIRRESGQPAIDLTESNPTRCAFRYDDDRILAALSDPRALQYEPEPTGLLPAREAVARRSGCDPDDLILTASTSEAYGWLFKLCCEPGDRVLIPRPGYPLFEFLAELEEVALDRYPLRLETRWEIDFDALEESITPRTRAIVLVHPNNPTGSAVTRPEALRLQELCAARGLAIISDEVFLDYLTATPLERGAASPAEPAVLTRPTGSTGPAGPMAEDAGCLAVSLGGLSKAAGLPQIKVGWMRIGGPCDIAAEARARLEVIADTYLSVNTPAQWALPALLECGDAVRAQIRARTEAHRTWLRREGEGDVPWQLLPADGGWYAVLRVPRLRSEEEWCLRLVEEEGVLLHPGYFFDFEEEAYLVASLLPEPARFEEAMRRVLRHLR